MSAPAKLALQTAGATDTGQLRNENEDVVLVALELGLIGVFDGMGGHTAGDVAAETARRHVVSTFEDSGDGDIGARLTACLERASAAIHAEAQERRDRHGMGTTAVIAHIAGTTATIAHVGDSRAYLLRGSRLRQLTDDHTVVAAMLSAGAITPEEALHHPYKNVLSRCLGHSAEVEVEIQTVPLEPGDRLLLCSDGLSGYASHEAIEQVLRGAESTGAATADLIDLALRGGGGDNVSCVVAFAGNRAIPAATMILRESGAHEWWRRRELFADEARKLGVASSPICSNLPAGEAIEVVAGNLCEAVFHDLEQTSGIHAWTYAENLAAGWLDRGGHYQDLRGLLDLLRDAAAAVLADIAAANASFAAVLEVEVMRSLIVMESAVAGVLADRLRQVESEAMHTHEEQFRPRVNTEQPTVPYLGGPRTNPPEPAVTSCLDAVRARALASLDDPLSMMERVCAQSAHDLAVNPSSGVDVLDTARELYDAHDQGTMPLFEALDAARGEHLRQTVLSTASTHDKAEAMRRLALSYQSLAHALAILVVDAGRPISDRLKEMAEHTSRMREQVRRGEIKVADLEARLSGATVIEE